MKMRLLIAILAVVMLTGCGSKNDFSNEETLPEAENVLCETENVMQKTENEELIQPDDLEETQASDSDENDTAEIEEPATVRIVMAGDMLLHTKVSESAHLENGSYDYNPIFAHTSDVIRSADIAMVNEEVIIGGEELGISGYPSFNAPFEAGDALVNNGFDVILHATNHAVDKGKRGLVNCMNFWEENYPDIEVLGIHDSKEDSEQITYIEKNGIRIAILNYTYGTNGISLPGDMPWSVDLLKEERVIADIKCAEENADFTIVCPHWGTEYNLGITKQQEKWAKIFVANGADLIIGTHPHVIEPVQWYEDEETGNRALVYYSIGNYVNWTSGTGSGTANRMVGGLADITIMMDNDNVSIEDYTVHGMVCHLAEGNGNVTTYFLRDYSQEMASENLMIKQDPAFSYDYCVELCNKVWDKWE